jgi:hypothetical protein
VIPTADDLRRTRLLWDYLRRALETILPGGYLRRTVVPGSACSAGATSNAGTIRAERRKVLGFVPQTRWTVLDAGRRAAVQAGLASAIGLPSLVYPGFAGRAARNRVAAAGKRGGPATHATKAAADAARGADAALDAATHAAVAAVTTAASDAGHGGHAGGGHD